MVDKEKDETDGQDVSKFTSPLVDFPLSPKAGIKSG